MIRKVDSSKQSLSENGSEMETEVIKGLLDFDNDVDLDFSSSTSLTIGQQFVFGSMDHYCGSVENFPKANKQPPSELAMHCSTALINCGQKVFSEIY